MILHLKSPNVICINQQSDILMYSSGLFQRHIVSHIKMEGTPPVTSTQLYIPKTGCFRQRFILCSKMEQLSYLFRRIEALLQGFLVLLRSILYEPVFGGFGQLRFNLVCSSTDVSYKPEISDIEIRCIVLSRQGTTKTLIRLCRCTGLSVSFLFTYIKAGFLTTWLNFQPK